MANSDTAKEWLKTQHRPACSCSECVSLCEKRPCWGTPEEIKKVIKAGFGDKLMDDYWAGGFNGIGDTHMIQPAIVGYENKNAPFYPHGRCALLDKDNKCMIHKIKPSEGAIAMGCKSRPTRNLHEIVAKTWDDNTAQDFVDEMTYSPH